MPTPSEQKALAFVAIVILLGGAVRVLRAGPADATPEEQQALARQSTAVDRAVAAQPTVKGGRRRAAAKRDTMPRVVGGVASVPPSFARPDHPFSRSPYGFPPPGARIDTDARGVRPPSVMSVPTRESAAHAPIDLDLATEKEIETLPRIGPALARRIRGSRDSLGPFKSLDGLRRVKGLGNATIETLAPLVSFGGRRPPLPH